MSAQIVERGDSGVSTAVCTVEVLVHMSMTD